MYQSPAFFPTEDCWETKEQFATSVVNQNQGNYSGQPQRLLSRNRFYLPLSAHCPKMDKNSTWEVKKKLKISVHGTLNPTMVAKFELLLKEHHQLTKFT